MGRASHRGSVSAPPGRRGSARLRTYAGHGAAARGSRNGAVRGSRSGAARGAHAKPVDHAWMRLELWRTRLGCRRCTPAPSGAGHATRTGTALAERPDAGHGVAGPDTRGGTQRGGHEPHGSGSDADPAVEYAAGRGPRGRSHRRPRGAHAAGRRAPTPPAEGRPVRGPRCTKGSRAPGGAAVVWCGVAPTGFEPALPP
jgi:hypothetical protein